MEVTTLGVRDEPVRDESAEHLAGGLGGDPEVACDLRGGHPATVIGADQDAQGEQVLLRRGGQVALIVIVAGHDLRIRDASAPGSRAAAARSRRAEPDHPGDDQDEAERRAPRIAVRRGPGRRQDQRRDQRCPEHGQRRPSWSARRAPARPAAARSTASWSASPIGSAEPSQVAANRPQPVSSPISQPSPSAIGSQPMSARTTRPRQPP